MTKLWYANGMQLVEVDAEERDDGKWYIPRFDAVIDGNDLFRTERGVLKKLKKKIEHQLNKKQEYRGRPTKVSYLWVAK
jgi:hypothetical protein